jgi:pimeloyl-ACP methyl ester carboxylesterase
MTVFGSIFYVSRGETQPPLVAIHGAGGTSRHWGHQFVRLSNVAQIFALDLPGHGDSSGATHRSIEDAAQRVLAFMNVLGMRRAVLMGHSMGGAIAQWVALHEPERVQGLVLVGSGARLRVNPAILEGIRNDWEATTSMLVESSYAPHAAPILLQAATAQLRKSNPDVLHADYTACNEFDILTEVNRIAVPTLVIVGEHDHMTPPKYAEFLVQTLPNAELVVVPQAGHMVMVEQPDQVNAAVRMFVERLKQDEG